MTLSLKSHALGAILAAFGALGLATLPAVAQETTIKGKAESQAIFDPTTDWPCVQRKVDKITPALMWDGPSIDDAGPWFEDEEVVRLIDRAAIRRIPLDDIEAEIKAFSEAQKGDARDKRMTLIFKGLFDKLARQRRTIMNGVVRFQKAQIQRSKEIERQSTAIEKIKLEVEKDPAKQAELDKAIEKFNWTQRIFQERQSSIPLACELPVLVEERLYGVARAIRAYMDN